MAMILILAGSSSFAKIATSSDFGISIQKTISWSTTQRIIKLAAVEMNYTYQQMIRFYEDGLLTIEETNQSNVYLVTLRLSDGGTVQAIIEDNF